MIQITITIRDEEDIVDSLSVKTKVSVVPRKGETLWMHVNEKLHSYRVYGVVHDIDTGEIRIFVDEIS